MQTMVIIPQLVRCELGFFFTAPVTNTPMLTCIIKTKTNCSIANHIEFKMGKYIQEKAFDKNIVLPP